MYDHTQRWAIVLAAGEGSRVRGFLSALCGGNGIKQFCRVLSSRSLLQMTLDRVQRLIPPERIIVIVDQRHRPEVLQQIPGWPEENIIYQPANRETAPGILLPLAHVSQRSPGATVAVFPSDHFIADEARFMHHVKLAIKEAEVLSDSAVLLGMTPDRLEEGYGWISGWDDRKSKVSQGVQGFWEKPPLPLAKQLMSKGALWNTFIFAAHAPTLWEMTRQTIPDLFGSFQSVRRMLCSARAEEYIEELYTRIRAVNFSSLVLTPSVSSLRVLPVPKIGWSDWGSADRILESALRMGRVGELAARLEKHSVNDPSMANFLSRYQTYREQVAYEDGG